MINGDQKAQILKKPSLQAQLAQFEEQVAQYQKIHDHYRAQAESDKASVDKAVAQARTEALAEANAAFEKKQHDGLMVVSQFLRLAAYRREEAADPESDETQAIEGVLLAIYAGDESAVSSLLKLVNGTDDKVLSVPGQLLNTDCKFSNFAIVDFKLTDSRRNYQNACPGIQGPGNCGRSA